MVFIAGAFAAALINVLVALALSFHLNVGEYYDISMMCGVLGEDGSACRAGALNAGYTMLAGLAICLTLGFAFNAKAGRPAVRAVNEQSAFGWCLLATVVLLAAHVTVEAFGTKELTRIAEITRLSSFISLENLLWPLLLQLMNSASSARLKAMYLSLLLPIVSLSPYRGVLLAVIVFGLGLPVIAWVAQKGLPWRSLLRQRQVIAGFTLALVVVGLLLFTMYAETRERTTEIAVAQTQSESQAKLTQRLAYPLFQAYFAERIAAQEELPTAGGEILHKFRLGSGQNLNEDLYSKVYGDGTVGEMTSLYFGEAVVNSASHPIVWIVAGPLLLVAIWLMLKRFGYEVGTLAGIAIWRGSLGGVASVMPALVVQLVLIMALARRTE